MKEINETGLDEVVERSRGLGGGLSLQIYYNSQDGFGSALHESRSSWEEFRDGVTQTVMFAGGTVTRKQILDQLAENMYHEEWYKKEQEKERRAEKAWEDQLEKEYRKQWEEEHMEES